MVRTRAFLILIAGAAMVGAHWLAYLLAAPDAHDRAALLTATGHGYWPLAAALAVAAVFVGFAGFIGDRIAPEVRTSRPRIFSTALPKLLVLQTTGFVLLEVTERVVAGHALEASTFLGPTMLIGLVVQIGAALLSATLLALVVCVIAHFTARPPRVRRTSVVPGILSLVPAARPLVAAGTHTLRGPPSLS